MSAQDITELKKIRIQRDGRPINTGTIIFTIGLLVLPSHFNKMGFVRVKVDAYIPNQLSCFKCHRYKHHKMTCKRELTCAKYGTTGHEDKECNQKNHPVNCDGNHGSFSRDSQVWKKEEDIQSIGKLSDRRVTLLPQQDHILMSRLIKCSVPCPLLVILIISSSM